MSILNPARKLVSIGIPVFNESARIWDCIGNVQAQSYSNIEICISDNCSSDGTYDLACRLAEATGNIRVMRQERHIGVFDNFGAVRRMARGEYFMWLGADDRISPTYVEKMVEELERNPQAAVVQSGVLRSDDSGNVIQKVRFSEAFDQNCDGPLVQARRALTFDKPMQKKKLNMYVYGLYRKAVIDEIVGERALSWGDRILPVLAALSGGLRYVDEFLFIKNVKFASDEKRPQDTPTQEERRRHRRVRNIILWVLTCPTVPIWRRWYGVIIAFPFMLEITKRILRRVLPRPMSRWFGISLVAKRKIKF